jgi:hypothetical protein
VYIHFFNNQNEAAWEVDLDSQIMVIKSTNGDESFGQPVPTVQLEDGLSDMPFAVISRQTVWGHQFRWNAAGNIPVNPTDPNDVTVVFADRGTPNPNATEGCFSELPGDPPAYDPCNAGPGSHTSVYTTRSTDGGRTWTGRVPLAGAGGRHQWFPWSDHRSDGSLAVAWTKTGRRLGTPPVNDEVRHLLATPGNKRRLQRHGAA